MKRLFTHVIVVGILWLAGLIGTPGSVYSDVLNKVTAHVAALNLSYEDLIHLREYMEFFSAWYAPVTPAPVNLHDSLPQEALYFVDRIKKSIKPLERKRDRRLLGSTRLTPEGKLLYQKVIELLKIKADSIKTSESIV